MSEAFTTRERYWMQRALALAARGRGSVEPNPMVGCVLVRGGRTVGKGYHRRFGGPHAEVDALGDAGQAARGSTAYVTLEPCCHYGKTPPCTDALIAAGVKRVVVAMPDQLPPVSGRGLRVLRKAGLEVAVGLCEDEARQLNSPYLKLKGTGRPWVILKWAQSIDGKIATRTGDSKWISGQESRRYAHRLRGVVDAVAVGVGTVIADDPALTCRLAKARRTAMRIVIDPSLRTPPSAQLVRTAAKVPTLIATDRRQASSPKARRLSQLGVEVLALPASRTGLNLERLLEQLGRREMTNILVEGGGRTLGSFVDLGLADEAVIFVSRRLIGGQGAPSPLSSRGPARIADSLRPTWTTLTRCGEDDIYHLRLK
jgi:diaminohydroxyphosphoribosylaminopyrimidine deaminase / 5-amino-6-(5-phosphoribosylamino)uracil reductase